MNDLVDMEDLVDKWTVRNVQRRTVRKLREIAFYSDLNIADCLTEAVDLWFDQLEEATPRSDE
ncbi:MAG: hypothetical protein HWE34_00865 [Methylocystaceae bacterium]|nr:hypothetical protein [Methylocystaceae bacterium]